RGYSLHRRKSDQYNPYAFVELEVNIPGTLTAECILVNSSATPSPASAVNHLLEKLRSNEFQTSGESIAAEDSTTPPQVAQLSPEIGRPPADRGNSASGSLPIINGFASIVNQYYFWKTV